MAFHVACPLTCRKICQCSLGAPGRIKTEAGKKYFVENALVLQRLLASAQFMLAGGEETVEVLVPRICKEQKKKKAKSGAGAGVSDADGEEDGTLAKRAVMRRKVTVATIAAAEAAAKAEQAKKAADAARLAAARQIADAEALMKAEGASGLTLIAEVGNLSSEHGLARPLGEQIACEICLFSENVGGRLAERMISCPRCSKKFHRKCVKQWAGNRDLFNWSSWMCGACRNCEVCGRTGEPNKLMFCKRCDGAYHTYCQQPPIKQVAKGPFLCPNHSQCHSCGSRVPGSGISSRWFLCYNFCDACGRLFVKQKYCPVCLKVYRDSEPLPMVCCDICEHWVHIGCDSISEERYEMFQADGNLRYKCPVCRGESYKVKDLDDGVRELWRRRDDADSKKIAEARAAAKLPSQEELDKLCPSDDEKQPVVSVEWTKDIMRKLSKKSSKSKSKSTKDGPSATDQSELKEEISYKIKLPKVKKVNLNPELTDAAAQKSKAVDGLKSSAREHGDTGNIHQVDDDVVQKKLKKLNATKAGIILTDSGKDSAALEDNNKSRSHSKSKKSHSRSKEVAVPADGQGNDKTQPGKEKLLLSIPKDKKRKTDALSGEEERKDLAKPAGPASKNSSGRVESDDDLTTQHGASSPPQSWAIHSESARRRRIPSSKFRDMDTSAGWRWKGPKDGQSGGEEKGRLVVSSYKDEDLSEGAEPTQASSKDLQSVSDQVSSEGPVEKKRKFTELDDDVDSRAMDDESTELPRKRVKVADVGKKSSKQKKKKAVPMEPAPNVSLRLKFKQNGAVSEDVNGEAQPLEDEEKGAIRGQRSKRKRPDTADRAEKLPAEKDLRARSRRGPKEGAAGDDCWILEKLGRDAISKRIEVYWPDDGEWYKGTVAGAAPQKQQFTVLYDDGEQRILRYGEEKVRLLSGSKSTGD